MRSGYLETISTGRVRKAPTCRSSYLIFLSRMAEAALAAPFSRQERDRWPFRLRLRGVGLSLEDLAGNERAPLPEVATDTLLKRIFNFPIFYRHGPDAIVTGRLTASAGAWSIYNSPATNITAARTIASIAVISSSISFTGSCSPRMSAQKRCYAH
jgi:hypothetical protein